MDEGFPGTIPDSNIIPAASRRNRYATQEGTVHCCTAASPGRPGPGAPSQAYRSTRSCEERSLLRTVFLAVRVHTFSNKIPNASLYYAVYYHRGLHPSVGPAAERLCPTAAFAIPLSPKPNCTCYFDAPDGRNCTYHAHVSSLY